MSAENEFVSGEDEENFVDELKPGTELMLGQYKIVDFLAAGGFGITYLAKDSLDRQVVIKECFPGGFCRRQNFSVLPRSRAHQNELKSIVRLFSQEALSLSKAGHPNIVGVHQVFEENNTAYMALDFVNGRDLLTILKEKPESLTPELVEGYLRKVLDAVGHVHSQGILHRDISPDNILVSEAGEPVLIDFGAARADTSDGNASRMLSALRVVKDGYSPQEFYIAGSEQGPSCDLYSLAASFYHIITGELPPDSQSRLTAFAENSDDPYVPLGKVAKGYSKRFCAALDKAMSVLPRDRMQSADEWLTFLEHGGTDAKKARRAKTDTSQASSKGKAMPFLLGGAALAAAAGVGMFYVNTSGDASAPANDAVQTAAAPETTAPSPTPVGTVPEDESTAAVVTTQAPAVSEPAVPEPVASEPEDERSASTAGPSVAVLSDTSELTQLFRSSPIQSAPQTVASAAEPQTDAVASVEPAAPRASQAPVPRPEDVAALASSDQVNAFWSVRLPFASDAADPAIVGEVLFPGWNWLREGLEVTSLNGVEVDDIAAIPDILRLTTDLTDQTQLEATIGVRRGAAVEEFPIIFPVTGQTILPNGIALRTVFENGGWKTSVAEVPAGVTIVLQPEDVLVEHSASGSAIDQRTSLADIAQSAIAAGEGSAEFLVARDGEELVVQLPFLSEALDALTGPAADLVAEPVSLPPNDVATVSVVDAPKMPFTLSETEGATVAVVAEDAPDWLVPGLQILSINSQPVTSNADILSRINAAASEANARVFDVAIGFEAQLADAAIERTLAIGMETRTTLPNGFVFATSDEGGQTVTRVAEAPEDASLAVGDKLVAYMMTGERLDGSVSLQSILTRELSTGKSSFSFAVDRSGEMWVEAFSLTEATQ